MIYFTVWVEEWIQDHLHNVSLLKVINEVNKKFLLPEVFDEIIFQASKSTRRPKRVQICYPSYSYFNWANYYEDHEVNAMGDRDGRSRRWSNKGSLTSELKYKSGVIEVLQ